MAFPTTGTVVNTNFSLSVTEMSVTMPSTVNFGDLLVAFVHVRNTGSWTTPEGWTEFGSQVGGGSVGELTAFYKIASGDEASTTPMWTASTATTASWQVRRITGWHGSAPPEITTASGDVSNANPPSITPSWGSEDTLYIAVAGHSAASATAWSSAPTGYEDFTVDGISAGGASVSIATAYEDDVTATSHDPDAFTASGSNRWWSAGTVAIRTQNNTDIRPDTRSNSGVDTNGNKSWTHTNSGNFVALFVPIRDGSVESVASATYNGVSMTKAVSLANATDDLRSEIWYLANAPTGANTLAYTMTDGGELNRGIGVSFYNVATSSALDQTASEASNGTGSATPDLSITPTTDGQLILGLMSSEEDAITTGSGEVKIYNEDNGTWGDATSYVIQGTAGAHTFNWSQASDVYIITLASFKVEVSGTATNDERSAKITGGATSNDERSAKTTGSDTANDERNSKITGTDTANSERNAKTTGTATTNDERSSKITGQESANDERSSKITGTATTTDERNAKVTGSDTANDEKNAKITGNQTANDERNAKITGTATATDEKSAKITGSETATDEISSKITGVDTATSERNSKITGTDTSSDERSSKITGSENANDERSAKLTGTDTDFDEINAKITGFLTTNDERSAKIDGVAGANAERDAKIIGTDTDTDERSAKVTGSIDVNSERDAKITGVAGANDEKSAKITGTDTDSDERSSKITGKETDTDERSSKITGSDATSDERSAKTTGKQTASDERDVKITGGQSTNDERSAKVTGANSETDERSAKIHGLDTITSERTATIAGVFTDTSERSAKITGGTPTSSERGAKIVGKGDWWVDAPLVWFVFSAITWCTDADPDWFTNDPQNWYTDDTSKDDWSNDF